MKCKLIVAAAVLTLATTAFAAPPKKAKSVTPTVIKCAVMPGRPINIKSATANKMYADYKGNRYFFCCGGCPSAFKSDPAKYAKNAHIPTPKAKKA